MNSINIDEKDTVRVCYRLESSLADFGIVTTFFIALFSDFDRQSSVEIEFATGCLRYFLKSQFSKEWTPCEVECRRIM